MFSLKVNEYDDVRLMFQNENIHIDCSPENPHALTDDGDLNSMPSNGEFNFCFDENQITFLCAKYGDGNGGYLEIKLKMTEDIKKSLDECIEKWRKTNKLSKYK